MAKTRAMLNKEIRQKALREQLAEQCRIQHVLDTVEKMTKLQVEFDGETSNYQEVSFDLQKYKIANEQRLKLINKYLPDLKAQEIKLEAEVVTKKASELTDDELASIISSVDDE